MKPARILLYQFPARLVPHWSDSLAPLGVEILKDETLEEGPAFLLGYWYLPLGKELPSPPSISPWVLVLPEVHHELCATAQEKGFLTVLPEDAPPWLICETFLRLRQRERMIDELHRLLQESVEFHRTLALLEEIRKLIPDLGNSRGLKGLLHLYMGIFEAHTGALWLRDFSMEERGEWFFQQAVSTPPPSSLFPESFQGHEIPLLAQLNPREPLILADPPYTLVTPLGSKEMLAGIVLLQRSQPFTRLQRQLEALRILQSWVVPLLSLGGYRGGEGEGGLRVSQDREFPVRIQHLLRLARRYERPLSTVWVWVPKPIWEQYDLLGILSSLLRDSDLLGEYDGEKIPLALPETSYMGGEYFLRRLYREVRRRYPQARLDLKTTLATTPYHGLLWEDLTHHHEEEYRSLSLLEHCLGKDDAPAGWLKALRRSGKGIPFHDPNLWGDLLYTFLSELSLVHPRESRLCLYLTDPSRIQKWFPGLTQASLAWDRVLLTGDQSLPKSSWGGLYVVQGGFPNPFYLGILDSPWGGLVALAEEQDQRWEGGFFWEKGWARVLFDRWENRFMIHKRWLAA